MSKTGGALKAVLAYRLIVRLRSGFPDLELTIRRAAPKRFV